jgi:hypothetical protein
MAPLIQPHDKKRINHRHALSEHNHSQLQLKTKKISLRDKENVLDCYEKPNTIQREKG